MSTSRHFIVEEPTLHARIEAWHNDVLAMRETRRDTLRAMGFEGYRTDGYGLGVVSMVECAPGKLRSDYGKGWRTAGKKYPGWLFPAPNSENEKLLHETLKMPSEEEIALDVMKLVVDRLSHEVCEAKGFLDYAERTWYPELGKNLPEVRSLPKQAKTRWIAEFLDDGRVRKVWATVGALPFEAGTIALVNVPDPSLPFESLPGMREIPHWEYLKLIADYDAEWKAKNTEEEKERFMGLAAG